MCFCGDGLSLMIGDGGLSVKESDNMASGVRQVLLRFLGVPFSVDNGERGEGTKTVAARSRFGVLFVLPATS